jgi:hypothetical protein
MKKHSLFFALAAAIFSLPAMAQTQEAIPADEHIQVVDVKASANINTLRLKTVMNLPQNLRSVQDTSMYLLEPVSYKLVYSPLLPDHTKRILARPLIRAFSDGSLKTIEDALLTISGDDTILVVDHVNKLITFELAPQK